MRRIRASVFTPGEEKRGEQIHGYTGARKFMAHLPSLCLEHRTKDIISIDRRLELYNTHCSLFWQNPCCSTKSDPFIDAYCCLQVTH